MVTNDLSAGICDSCIHCGTMYGGNGIDEPLQTVPYCPRTQNEIIPVPDNHKEMRITDCDCFETITIAQTETI